MRLYDLSKKYLQLLEIAESVDEETLNDTLSSIEDAIEEKAENTAKVIRNLEAQAEAFKTEEYRLAARRKAIENNAKRLKLYLQEELERVGADKIKGELFTIAIQNNPKSVEVLDETLIPKKYFIEQRPKLDKKALLDELKTGADIEGVEIKQSRSVRIR